MIVVSVGLFALALILAIRSHLIGIVILGLIIAALMNQRAQVVAGSRSQVSAAHVQPMPPYRPEPSLSQRGGPVPSYPR